MEPPLKRADTDRQRIALRKQQMNYEAQEEAEQQTLTYKMTQQLISAWKPVPSAFNNVLLYSLLTAGFLVGGLIIISSLSTKDLYTFRYDDKNGCAAAYRLNQQVDPKTPLLQTNTCDLPISIPYNMEGPVVIQYSIDNFYQNHRKYLNSISKAQLQGTSATDKQISDACAPFSTNYQMEWFQLVNDYNKTAYPCGAIAKSMFNDSFVLYFPNNTEVTLKFDGVAQSGDANLYVENPSLYPSANPRVRVSSEAWRVWARPSTTKTLLKNYAFIPGGLPSGQYTMRITNRYRVNPDEGKKSVVLANASLFGSQNYFLGASYMALAAISFIVLFMFISLSVRQQMSKEYERVADKQILVKK